MIAIPFTGIYFGGFDNHLARQRHNYFIFCGKTSIKSTRVTVIQTQLKLYNLKLVLRKQKKKTLLDLQTIIHSTATPPAP